MSRISDQKQHKNIIELHRIELYQSRLSASLAALMLRKSQKWHKRILNNIKARFQTKIIVYENLYVIDKYVDDYWYINCPEHISIKELDQKVYRLIHELLLEVDPEPEEVRQSSHDSGDDSGGLNTQREHNRERENADDGIQFQKSEVVVDPCYRFTKRAEDSSTYKKRKPKLEKVSNIPKEFKNDLRLQVDKDLLQHAEYIHAIMLAIKPGLWSYFNKRFTQEMVKAYFRQVRREAGAAQVNQRKTLAGENGLTADLGGLLRPTGLPSAEKDNSLSSRNAEAAEVTEKGLPVCGESPPLESSIENQESFCEMLERDTKLE